MKKIFQIILISLWCSVALSDVRQKLKFEDYGGKTIEIEVIAKTLATPAPTIIISHGCYGLSSHEVEWANFLVNNGFNAVYYEAHKPRMAWYEGNKICENTTRVRPNHRVRDFYAIEEWIDMQGWHKGGIGIIGYSNGGWHALDYLRNAWHIYRERVTSVKAIVGYYPYCSFDVITDQIIPLQVHIGDKDDWTASDFCQKLKDMWDGQRKNKTADMELYIYEGVHHSFDRKDANGTMMGGHGGGLRSRTVKYDAIATELSKKRTIEFFKKHLIESLK